MTDSKVGWPLPNLTDFATDLNSQNLSHCGYPQLSSILVGFSIIDQPFLDTSHLWKAPFLSCQIGGPMAQNLYRGVYRSKRSKASMPSNFTFSGSFMISWDSDHCCGARSNLPDMKGLVGNIKSYQSPAPICWLLSEFCRVMVTQVLEVRHVCPVISRFSHRVRTRKVVAC